MNACPSEDELLRLLDEDLNVDDDARLVAHVESCAACYQQLERLTSGCPRPGEGRPI
jgi:hypothetical protein